MKWIIDLLIDKLQDKKKEKYEPIPLYIDIEDEYLRNNKDREGDKDKNNTVIIIDL